MFAINHPKEPINALASVMKRWQERLVEFERERELWHRGRKKKKFEPSQNTQTWRLAIEQSCWRQKYHNHPHNVVKGKRGSYLVPPAEAGGEGERGTPFLSCGEILPDFAVSGLVRASHENKPKTCARPNSSSRLPKFKTNTASPYE